GSMDIPLSDDRRRSRGPANNSNTALAQHLPCDMSNTYLKPVEIGNLFDPPPISQTICFQSRFSKSTQEARKQTARLIPLAWLVPLVGIRIVSRRLVDLASRVSFSAKRIPQLSNTVPDGFQPGDRLVGLDVNVGAPRIQLRSFDVRLPIDAGYRPIIRKTKEQEGQHRDRKSNRCRKRPARGSSRV